ncbi:uncharacterized protein [Littorina saxatilis]|uniref:uncharacterized protein n=1 Tax=Littorina saxatilis TaxID=31220 RepID=UPI0038B59A4B
MASAAVLTVLAALLLCALTVSGENCQAVKSQAEANCGGMGCRQVICEGDDFAATQCFGSVCNCVKADGSPIERYTFQMANYGDCHCAREEAAGSNSADCQANGSY